MNTFGQNIKEDFIIENGFVCVNHSSFGFVPKEVFQQRIQHYTKFLQNPDRFTKIDYPKYTIEIRKTAAEFLNADFNQCMLTSNSAEAFNSIIRNLGLTENDTILYFSTAYPMVQNTIQFMTSNYNVKQNRIELKRQHLEKQKILSLFEEQLKTQKITIAVFDNISAQPSLIMPIKELISLCKKYNVISIVDAAHGAGITVLDIKDLDPDFLFTNFNKWAFCPSGINILYLKEQYLNKIHHNTISVQYGNGLAKECEFSGTKDFSLSLSLIDGVNFIKKYGLNQIIKYSEDLAWEGANLVAQIWQTELLVNDKSMHSAMVNVKIPHQDQNYCRECQKKCFEKYNVFLVVFKYDDLNWSRLSASLYNTISDYEYAARCYLKVLKGEE
ncbi:unnamed protein product [Paramecium pentaurelia]|uniref:Aminotransferase class V domain-containing protein n=1 Tax=Paramecium pentaurelia TaxID=43138 RepID=A0A8S1WBU1_9CILI|nr:unnamed protein product [Paramecium pentaurelia]